MTSIWESVANWGFWYANTFVDFFPTWINDQHFETFFGNITMKRFGCTNKLCYRMVSFFETFFSKPSIQDESGICFLVWRLSKAKKNFTLILLWRKEISVLICFFFRPKNEFLFFFDCRNIREFKLETFFFSTLNGCVCALNNINIELLFFSLPKSNFQ